MDLVIRAAVAFAFVYLLTRVIGRRELSSMQPFDLILLVMIGDLVQQGVTQNDFSVTGAMLVGGTIALMTVAVSYLSFRFPRLRPALDGEPVIVVEDGKPIERNLRRNRITLEELAAAARAEPDRVARRRPLGRARDQRTDQLHPEGLDCRAALPDRGGRRRPDHAGGGGAGARGVLPPAWPPARSRTCRGGGSRSTTAASPSCPRSTASSATRA